MRKIVLAVAAPFVIATLVAVFGLGPRLIVAKQKIVNGIDDVLGRMDVAKIEIDTGIKAAKSAADGIRKARIKAEIGLELLEEKTKPDQEEIVRSDQALAKLRDAIRSGVPTDIAGKTYSTTELKDMGTKVLQHRKIVADRIQGFEKSRENVRQVVTGLKKREDEIISRIGKLESANAKLGGEMEAAKAMKAAAAVIGNADMPLAVNLDELEQKIAVFAGEIRAELTGGSWSGAEKTDSDVTAIISQTPADPCEEIDRILAQAKK